MRGRASCRSARDAGGGLAGRRARCCAGSARARPGRARGDALRAERVDQLEQARPQRRVGDLRDQLAPRPRRRRGRSPCAPRSRPGRGRARSRARPCRRSPRAIARSASLSRCPSPLQLPRTRTLAGTGQPSQGGTGRAARRRTQPRPQRRRPQARAVVPSPPATTPARRPGAGADRARGGRTSRRPRRKRGEARSSSSGAAVSDRGENRARDQQREQHQPDEASGRNERRESDRAQAEQDDQVGAAGRVRQRRSAVDERAGDAADRNQRQQKPASTAGSPRPGPAPATDLDPPSAKPKSVVEQQHARGPLPERQRQPLLEAAARSGSTEAESMRRADRAEGRDALTASSAADALPAATTAASTGGPSSTASSWIIPITL